MELNYRINIIKKDETVVAKFVNKETAKTAIRKIKKWFPNEFITGALEEKKEEEWKVIWILKNDRQRRNYKIIRYI